MEKENTNALVFLDVETLPERDEFSHQEPTMEDVGENGTLKDPVKIAEWKDKKLKELRDKSKKEAEERHHETGLVSYKGRIFCISFAIGDGDIRTVNFLNGEKQMLVEFYEAIRKYKTLNFVGCNIAFDLCFILHRSLHFKLFDLANLVRADRGYTKGRDWDIMEMFYGGLVWKPKVSLDNICKLLGVPTSKDEMNGSEVFSYYLQGKYDEIQRYCEKDVDRTRKCFKILK